ncbi:MAG: T9SS type A sorting domain-containing protein [Polaribacter sp.]|jgi:plastocyanin|nr:T9SS type A sorting domain-containing protein [Polaribacter sp.]
MIKKLPFIFSLMLTISLASQNTNTVNIDWSFNSTPSATGNANSSRTIEIGDTVTWNWYSGGNHNVKSKSTANESFESQFFGNGGTFSHTFTSIGTNDYLCSPHPGTMFGTITVVAEGTLSIDSFDMLGTINMYPNPTDSNLTIDFKIQNIEKLNIEVFNLLGKEVLTKQISKNDTSLLVSGLSKGVYLVRITSLNGENSTTKRFVKI